MPEGQYLGNRESYIYVADDNNSYVILRDVTLANIPGVDLTLATTANSVGSDDLPKRFTCRGVYWESTGQSLVRRKFLICGSRTSDLYTATGSTSLTIDGITGATTGRKGEQKSYRRLGSAPGP